MTRTLLTIAAGILCFSNAAFSVAATAPAEGSRDYIIAASRYLNVQKEGGLRVNKAIAGLKAQEATGEYFRKTVQTALSETNDDWDSNYSKSAGGTIPASFTEIDRSIQQSHKLRQAAYKEWLGDPQKQDPLSTASANESYKISLALEQKALSDLIDVLAAKNTMR